MRIDLIWNDSTTTVDLADGLATVGGSPKDGICIEGLPHGLLTLRLEGSHLSVTAQRSVRVGDALFPARVARLLIEGEELKLPNDVVIRRVVDQKKRDSRKLMATAFVAQELLSGEIHAEDTRAATFTCVTGLDAGRVFPIPFDDNIIGRADEATIRIRDRAVSRQHARLVRDGRHFKLSLVTSSMNGVYVNGLLLKKDTVLKTGDVVEVGQTILRFDTSERAPEERTVVAAEELVPAPIAVPQAAEPAPQLELTPAPQRLSVETVLMSAGIALTLLGVVAAGWMLR
ncbi:MAG: FHA domain-containing protein [Archangium sp.]|nr:FHA domain-containing protein [Archangium sp.]MDP3156246.1 FHA domain-containing protein [Archangium sp.]MDP3571583.1 FHA domain-containing protein [Archangium sp.]